MTNDNLKIWDRSPESKNIPDYNISYPNPENLSDDFKQNGYLILAFVLESHYPNCEALLREHGIKNIIRGLDLRIHLRSKILGKQYDEYKAKNNDNNFIINDGDLHLVDHDMFSSAGASLNDDYLLQDLWAAQRVYRNKPDLHYDIGSSIAGFITHLLSFDTNVVLIDIRPLDAFNIKNLTFICSDATDLANIENESIESLSAICSLEHFGLGRYGDPIDPDAHIKAFKNIQRVMKPGSNLYISVPIAKTPRLVFNAHRIYSPDLICNYLDKMELKEFSYTSPKGLVEDIAINEFMNCDDVEIFRYNNVDLYITGLFHFMKK